MPDIREPVDLPPGTQVLGARRFIDLDRCYYCDEVVYVAHPAGIPTPGVPHIHICDVCMTLDAPVKKEPRLETRVTNIELWIHRHAPFIPTHAVPAPVLTHGESGDRFSWEDIP